MATAPSTLRADTHWLGSRTFAELTAALAVLAVGAGAGYQFLDLYQRVVLPGRPAMAVPTPVYGVPLADREAVERLQRVKQLLGEASAYRVARREDWAEARGYVDEALRLDAANPTALALHQRLTAS
ncbi:MAG TPA: hypothetical protein VFN74_05315 [Chloroflexota bacterium]|nr:hypothetical protein [Chloroflexota bacterium]